MRKISIDGLILVAVLLFAVRNMQLFHADLYYQRGERQSREKRFDQALRHYEQASAILTERAQYQRARGRTCLKLYHSQSGNLRHLYMAYHAFQQVLKLDAVYPYGWSEMGMVLQAFQEAGVSDKPSPEPYFERAHKIDPTNPLFLIRLIKWYLKQSRLDEAKKLFSLLVISYPDAIKLFGKKLLQSKEDLIKFANQLGNDPDTNLQYARLLLRMNYPELAEAQLERISPSDRLRPDLAVGMASIKVALDQHDEAKQMLVRAFEAAPHELAIARYWARILVKEKDLTGAIEVYQKALKANPGNWELNLSIAQLAQKTGQDELALENYAQALDSKQASARVEKGIYTERAAIKLKQGDLRGALMEYEKALQIEPGDAKLANKVKRLRVKLKYQNLIPEDR
jgi:tetratricopeptide (TPR) repeat protein